MRKKERQRIIRRLLSTNDLETQEDFVKILSNQNIWVTQATISRDIKEMQLVKVPSPNGGYRYSLPTQKNVDTEKKLVQSIQDSFVSIDTQDKLVFMKVLPGSGPIISSLLYQLKNDDVFGTLGDDNTVLVICVSDSAAEAFKNRVNEMLKGI
ncbi:ArgR family transcriptional regulator [Lentilactobacillus curieae]|uniref:Arginine repressor n=1 Tax=Lentilactobacillus curieae TaxID=1138822 RepID=A0A1S6QK67_9LACO|nr:arginine repressor [Lentilactobacillus curieae]AQW22005.1 ArgR family transcriptional regulator [Lentilactobacillus curieae]